MRINRLTIVCCVVVSASLTSCGFVAQQLADKAQEERLLKPGALDTGITTNFNEYQFRFLDRYRVRHQWPVTSACRYAQYPTKYKRSESGYNEVKIVDDIYEDGSGVWQRGDPRQGFGSYVKSVIRHQPIYGPQGLERYEDQEQGLQPVCFQAWVGTSHAITLMLYKRTLDEWDTALLRWQQGAFAAHTTKRYAEDVGGNKWRVYDVELQSPATTRLSGPFELRIFPLGDTNYTIALEFGANQNSLRNPQAHAEMQVLFRHLIESVKIEPLTPAIEAELAQLNAQAEEIFRQDCVEMAKRTKPGAWCQKYFNH